MLLREYQTDIATRAATLLCTDGIAYLSMQVRTGKTATALHAARLYGATHVLFVTRKKAIGSITGDATALMVPYKLTVINYEQLHSLSDDATVMILLEGETPNRPDLVICDEAHCLGAFPKLSKRTTQLRAIVGAKPLILLSGTPTPESWSQIFHQLHISSRSPWAKYKTFYKWAMDFVRIKQRRFSHGLVNDYSNADKVAIDRDIRHLFLTYTQEEAGFSQLVKEQVLTVPMAPITYQMADALQKRRIITNGDGHTVLADTSVKLMQKLHQIYSGTVIIDNPERQSTVFDTSKGEYIKANFAGKKIAIFYKFIAEGAMLKFLFDWTEDPDEFNASTDKVFISQVQSGREGINLSTAEALIMLNIDFSAVSYWQSRARLQSKDRTTPAKVYWLFAINGIEEKIYQVVQGKKDYTLQHFQRDFQIEKVYA
jgi:hypothetical protein